MKKQVFPLLVLIAGIAMTLVATYSMRETGSRLAESQFRQSAEAAVNALQGGVDRNVDILESFAAFYAHDEVSREEFHRFAGRLLPSHGDIQALEWIPRVADGQRVDYEERARREDFPDFRITERLSQGRMVPAAPRPEYFPVYFVEPLKGNEIAAGFDLASDPTRREALEMSRDSGSMVATARITLVQEKASQAGFLIFQPIYRPAAPLTTVEERRLALRGFALGVFRIGDMADYALRNTSAIDATLSLRDLDAPAGDDPLYRHALAGTFPTDGHVGGHRVDLPMQVPGRHWSVHLESTPAFDAAHGNGLAWGTLASGLLFTGVLVVFLHAMNKRADEQQEHAAVLADANCRLQAEIDERQRAESRLRESEERFRGAFQHAAIGMALVGLGGRWLKVNDALCQIVGYSEAELLSRTFQDITHPEDLQADLDYVRQLLAGEIGFYHMEKRYLRKDGDAVWILLSVSLVRNVEGAPIHFVTQIEDINERKKAVQALADSELRFRTILDAAVDGILLADADTHSLVTGNHSICDMLGYRIEELPGLGVDDIHPAAALPEVQRQFERQLKGESRVAPDLPVKRKDGSVFFADISSSPMRLSGRSYLVGVFHDVTERKRRETELRLFRTLLDNSSDAVEILDPATLRFLDINAKQCADLGYSREELLAMGVADIDPRYGPEMEAEVKEQMRRTGAARFETRHRRRDGSTFPVEISSIVVELDRPYMLSIVRDITERKQVEEHIRRLSEALKQSHEAIFVANVDLRFEFSNAAATRLLGYTTEELAGQPISLIGVADEGVTDPLRVADIAAMQGGFAGETLRRAKDGRSVPVLLNVTPVRDESGHVIDYVGTMTDLTGIRRIEDSLRESEEKFRSISAAAQDAIIMIDEGGRVNFWNAAAEAIFGYPADEALGKDMHLLCAPPRFHHAFREGFDKFATTGRGAAVGKTLELAAIRKGGEEFPIEISLSSVRHKDRWHAIGIVRDISKRKRAEQEARQYLDELARSNSELKALNSRLEQAQSHLLQSEKMASIGMLAAGVAHEINNPIGFVKSNMQALGHYVNDLLRVVNAYEQVEVLLPEHRESFSGLRHLEDEIEFEYEKQDILVLLSESGQGLERVIKIVQDIKDFSRIGTEETWMEDDIHKGLDSTLNVIWNELKYTCEVRKEYGLLPPVECLLSQLNQVFMNLLVNAAQSIETKGTITIRTGTDGEMVWIEIADTGNGIAPANLGRIFDPFFTTKPVGKGTGLGLSVSYSIVQKHHGRITVESEVGKGTAFRVWLPVKQPEASANG